MNFRCVLFYIIVAEVTIISVFALIYGVMIVQEFQNLHMIAVQDCIRQNLAANSTTCLV